MNNNNKGPCFVYCLIRDNSNNNQMAMSHIYEDPLGFTKRTASILDGLGAGEIANEFKKRHISTDALGKLTKDDFIKLGASIELADSMYQQFNTKNQYRQAADSNDDNR